MKIVTNSIIVWCYGAGCYGSPPEKIWGTGKHIGDDPRTGSRGNMENCQARKNVR